MSISSSAQIKQFSDTLFIRDLGIFMEKAIDNNEEIEQTFIRFKENWEQGFITEGYQFGIILTSNILLSRRGRASTHFYYYLKTINGFIDNNKMEQYMEWEMGFVQLLDIQNEYIYRIDDFLKFSALLVGDNILIQNPSFTWQAKQDNFIIINDPEKEKLTVEFQTFDLMCYNKSDTITIYNTEGILYPTDKKWVGKNGVITWERAGFSKDSIFATIPNYKIDMNSSRYEVDTVLFTNKKYNQKDIIGRVENKLMTSSGRKNPSYPKFYSNEKNIFIKDILPSIDFKGGFNMIGNELIGTGTDFKSAQLFIKRKNKIFIRAESKKFTFTQTEIDAFSTSAYIYLDNKDSIYHSNIHLNYKQKLTQKDSVVYPYFWNNFVKKGDDMQLLSLARSGKGTSQSPFFDTYHQYNIYASEILWKRNDSLLYINTSLKSADKKATFESNNFFSMKIYNSFQGYDNINHLSAIKLFFSDTEYNSFPPDEFSARQYTDFINSTYRKRLTEDQIHAMLIKVSNQGFINYQSVSREAKINQKLFNWIGNRSRTLKKKGGREYDIINITSDLPNVYGVNAIINLKDLEMEIYHPDPVLISKARRVSFYTDQIKVNKNREMTFDGQLRAGLADFYGKKFTFDYDKFDFEMPTIDSIALISRSDSLNKFGTYDPIYVQSIIEETNGHLQIDKIDNKDGLRKLDEYPHYSTKDTAMVYYDKVDATYNKDDFYVKSHGMDIDSMNFINKHAVEVDGIFHSNVFPEFEVTLSLQDDYSLGFIKNDTANG